MNIPLLEKLKQKFEPGQKYILLFSGGLDSCCVLAGGLASGADITPVWIDNGFNRAVEKDIRQQAQNMGSEKLIVLHPSPEAEVVCNPTERCYKCKKQILKSVFQEGAILLDGTVADDRGMYRPGKKALMEFDVRSFLEELGISKKEAAEIAGDSGADTTIASLESCLATRINYNMEITPERLDAIRKIETHIIEYNSDYHVRCRIDDEDHLRIEISDFRIFISLSDQTFRQPIIDFASKVATFTTFDLKRSRPNEYDKKIK